MNADDVLVYNERVMQDYCSDQIIVVINMD